MNQEETPRIVTQDQDLTQDPSKVETSTPEETELSRKVLKEEVLSPMISPNRKSNLTIIIKAYMTILAGKGSSMRELSSVSKEHAQLELSRESDQMSKRMRDPTHWTAQTPQIRDPYLTPLIKL